MTSETQQTIDRNSKAAEIEAIKRDLAEYFEETIEKVISGQKNFTPLISLEPFDQANTLYKDVLKVIIEDHRDATRKETTKLKQREEHKLFVGPVKPRVEIVRYPIKGKGETSEDNII